MATRHWVRCCCLLVPTLVPHPLGHRPANLAPPGNQWVRRILRTALALNGELLRPVPLGPQPNLRPLTLLRLVPLLVVLELLPRWRMVLVQQQLQEPLWHRLP